MTSRAIVQRRQPTGRDLMAVPRTLPDKPVALAGLSAATGAGLRGFEPDRLCARAGLPRLRRQVLRREPSGKTRYLDAEFDLPDGTVLAVEIDGAVYLQPESWWDDSARQNEVVIAGRPMLRLPSLTVRLDGPAVVDQLRRMRLAHAA